MVAATDGRAAEEMIRACESVQTPEIEKALFKLAENDAAFYDNHAWCDAVRRRGTLASARHYLDLVIEGKIDGRDTSREITDLLNTHSALRDYAYGLLKDGTSPKAALLANAVAEGNDPDGLLLLVELENKLQRSLISWRTIQGAVTDHAPSEHWRGAFDVLRRVSQVWQSLRRSANRRSPGARMVLLKLVRCARQQGDPRPSIHKPCYGCCNATMSTYGRDGRATGHDSGKNVPRCTEQAVPLLPGKQYVRPGCGFSDTTGIGGAQNHLNIGGMPHDPRNRDTDRCDAMGIGEFVQRLVEFGIVVAVANEHAVEKPLLEGRPCLQHHSLEPRIVEKAIVAVH